MKRQRIPTDLRRLVREQAYRRCGYCLRPEELTGERMSIEHLHPKGLGGKTIESNLWLACRSCNESKGPKTHAEDPATGKRVRLFNPRKQQWDENFIWDKNGVEILGITPIGRATVAALRLNNIEACSARRHWVAAGWWPPET